MISKLKNYLLQNKKIVGIALVVILIILVAITCSVEKDEFRDYSEIQAEGKLRVVTDYNSIDYFIYGDTAVGFQYELVNALCDSLQLKPEWVVENSFDESLRMLDDGEVDLIARNIPITTELREQVSFSVGIIQIPQVLVQRKAEYNNQVEPIRNQLLLAGKTLYVPKNSPTILRINNLADEIADTIHIIQDDKYESEQLMMMVAKGEIDYAVCNRQIAKKNALMMPELDINTAVGFTQLQAWALNPSSEELKAKVDSFLMKFTHTEGFRDIYKRYYK